MHMTGKDHFLKIFSLSVHSPCNSCICCLDGRALLTTLSSTLMLASMISMFHLDTFTLVMQDSFCVTVSSYHIVVSVIICRNGVELINGSIFVMLSSIPSDTFS